MDVEITQEIFSRLMERLPIVWDGKESILFMKENECRNWRQMEWPGWYFQFMCETILGDQGFFNIPGPAYGNVEFDGFRSIPWDFKAHSATTGDLVPTNGYAEIECAIRQYGEVGFIIASGDVDFDDDCQSFKQWHDNLKGKTSAYEMQRIERGAPSRRRKVTFILRRIEFVFVNAENLHTCGSFQAGMRNSDGSPRNPKVMLNLNNPNLEKHIYEVK